MYYLIDSTARPDSTADQIWKKFENKRYRDAFVTTNVSSTVAAQISSMREDRGWKQVELAQRAGMSQGRISVLEDPSYDKFTLSTLKRVASAFDVALVVRFVPFSELANWTANVSPSDLTPASFAKDHLYSGEPKSFQMEDVMFSIIEARTPSQIFIDESTPDDELPLQINKTDFANIMNARQSPAHWG